MRASELRVGPLVVTWYREWGDWFVYVHLRKRFWRFSSAGYLTGVVKDEGMQP